MELEIQTFPIKLQNRATVLGSARDVTKRKKTERKMEQALQEAENSNRVKNLFLENMSHEIRTPLNSILGFAEILNDRLGRHLDKDEHFMFTSIKASGERLLRTVHEVLDIAQFEAGTMITTPEKLTLSDLVRNVVAEYREIATEKGLELTYTDTAGELQLMLDGDTIYKAISHLVHNAVKYSDEGSVRLQLYAEAGEYRLSIGDTGIGMSAEYIENIYDAFSQESTGYTKKYQGLGLGLALTKRYLDANKVNLSFESKKDQGTTFLLTFSSALEVKGETGTTPVPDEQVGETPVDERFKYTILVVEDDIPSQLLLKHLLADNHQLHYAKSVVEARRCLKENKIDLVILDLSLLGNEDGLDLVHHMQKNKSHRDIPVIAVTAHAFTQDRKNVLEAGCVEFITKPVTGDDVKNVIERILRSGE